MSWLVLGLVVLLVPLPALPGRRRIRAARQSGPGRTISLNHVGAVGAAVAALLLLPLPWSLPTAVVVGAAAHRLLPRDFTRSDERRALAVARSLPDAVDLLAAVLRAGLPDAAGLALVASATPDPLGGHLAVVARHRRLGATAREAWSQVGEVPQLIDLAIAMARHADTGSAAAPVLDRVAADARREYFARAQVAARGAAVRSVIPLAVCFLPAFVLLGVAPIVASLVSGLTF